MSSKMNFGAGLIAAERQRQIEQEGWTAANDDGHKAGQLAKAAAVLAVSHTDARVVEEGDPIDDCWGLAAKHYRDEIRTLTIAGALIAAEIDRLQRWNNAHPIA